MKTVKPEQKRCVLAQDFNGENFFGVVRGDYLEIRHPFNGFRGRLIELKRVRKWIYEKEINLFMD